jgi:cold shock protein
VSTGKVLRFDQVRGYGFIAPDGGGEDIFLHANDLLVEKHLVTAGTTMEFDVEQGDRGPKATSARIARPAGPAPSGPTSGSAPRPNGSAPGVDGEDGDDFYYVSSPTEFTREVTEILLQTEPTLTGLQILQIRRQLARLAEKNGWIEN